MIPTGSLVPGSVSDGEALGDAGGTDVKPWWDFAELIKLPRQVSYMRTRS